MSEIRSLGLGWHALTVTQPELLVLDELVTLFLVLNAKSMVRKGEAQRDVRCSKRTIA